MRVDYIYSYNFKNILSLSIIMDITCPICFDTFNDKDKIPRILQCGHTFCQSCLMDLRTSNILTCPTCRKYFSADVKQLIKNFTILGKSNIFEF
jgi:uncharacterized protein YbaR (Trm112 family)